MTFLKDFNLYDVYLKWRQGSGVFECFCKSTPFVCLKNYPNFQLEDATFSDAEKELYSKINNIINSYDNTNTLFILDISGEESIKMACLLQNEKSIKPIITFNAIIHPYGLVQGKNFINNILTCGNALKETNPEGFIFILDKNRYLKESNGMEENSFNNQYETTEEDMPRAEFLKELAYNKVVYMYKEYIKEDINCYLDYLEQFDIKIDNYKIGDYENE